MGETLIVGIGSPHGDDSIGWRVIDRLRENLEDTVLAPSPPCRRRDTPLNGQVADSAQAMGERAGVRGKEFSRVAFRKANVPIDMLDWLTDVNHLHIVDAGVSVEPHDIVTRLDYLSPSDRTKIESLSSRGTHDFGCVRSLRLAQSLGTLPDNVTIWIGSATDVTSLGDLTPAAIRTIDRCARAIMDELRDTSVDCGSHSG